MHQTHEDWQKRMAAWAQTFWQERDELARAKSIAADGGVFDSPTATFDEVVAASSWNGKGGRKHSAETRAKMSASQKAWLARNRW